jgi:hypothetical protein
MKTTFTYLLSYLSAAVALFTLSLHAQNDWTGNAYQGAEFRHSENWSTGFIPGQTANNHLRFGALSGHYQHQPVIDAVIYRIQQLTFMANADRSYLISGTDSLSGLEVTATGTITNNSALTHTLATNLWFLGQNIGSPAVMTARPIFDIQAGTLIWSGVGERSSGVEQLQLLKKGAGSLVLEGDHGSAVAGISSLQVNGGEVVLDLSKGATFSDTMNILFDGNGWAQSSTRGVGGVLRVVGNSSGTTTLALGELRYYGQDSNSRPGAAARVIVDANGGAGTTLQFADYTGALNNANQTLNFDLSSSEHNTIRMKLNMLNNGINRFTTVTSREIVNGDPVIRTGFAVQNGDNVERLTDFTAFPTLARRDGSGSGELVDNTVNYAISGHSILNGSNGSYQINSLTIQGAGSITASLNPDTQELRVLAILMEEGFAGDFHIDVRHGEWNNQLFVHQYNQQGTLYFNQGVGPVGVLAAANNASLIKSGPGTVVVNGNSDGLGNFIHVLEGRLELNGSFGSVGSGWANDGISVESGGILAGSAVIGGNGAVYEVGQQTTTKQAHLYVYSGGVLDATNAEGKNAINLAGKLTMNAGSVYRMTIASDRGNAFHVARTSNPLYENPGTIVELSGVDLQLTLDYAPVLNEIITLLTWDPNYTRTGTFLTINGDSFHDGNKFYLGDPLNPYELTIFYDNTAGSVYLQVVAVPEPSVVALWIGLGLSGVLLYKRHRR